MRRDKNNAASTGSTARSYFKQLERRFQLGLILAFFIPLAGLSTYFHIQFTFTLKETGQLNLAAPVVVEPCRCYQFFNSLAVSSA